MSPGAATVLVVATLHTLTTYPDSGFPDRCWDAEEDDEGDATLDVAARTALPVGMLYSEALAGLGVENRIGQIIVYLGRNEVDPWVDGLAEVDPGREGPEWGFLRVPDGFETLPAGTRAEVILEGIDGIVRTLAEARGWSAPFDACAAHVRDEDFTAVALAPWKWSPDRKHRARLHTTTSPGGAGFGRTRLEVADRDGRIVLMTPEVVGWPARRGQKGVRWDGSAAVRAEPYPAWAPGGPSSSLRAECDGEGWTAQVHDDLDLVDRSRPDPAAVVPQVRVRRSEMTVPEEPRHVSTGGGGPIQSLAIEQFDDHVSKHLKAFHSRAGRRWWEQSPIRHVTGLFDYQRPRTQVRTRLVGEELRIFVDVSDDDLREHGPEAWAEHVAGLVVGAVRRRAGLGPHPGYPDA